MPPTAADDDAALPGWGRAGRTLARGAWSVFGAVVCLGMVTILVDLVSGFSAVDWMRTQARWLFFSVGALQVGALAIGIVGWCVWMAGSFASGWRED